MLSSCARFTVLLEISTLMWPREVPGFLRWKTLAHWLLAAMQGLIPPGARGNLTAYSQLLLKKQLEPTVLVASLKKE